MHTHTYIYIIIDVNNVIYVIYYERKIRVILMLFNYLHYL